MKSTKTNINFLDLLLVLTILFSLTGYVFAKNDKTSLNKIIQGKEKIAIEVLLSDVIAESNNLFKIGNKTALTIRNRPHGSLKITNIESKPKQVVIPTLNGSFKTIEDPTRTHIKDYIITLEDTALKTNDGYVVSGNKLKVGNPVELEGFNYRLNGKVINVYSLDK